MNTYYLSKMLSQDWSRGDSVEAANAADGVEGDTADTSSSEGVVRSAGGEEGVNI